MTRRPPTIDLRPDGSFRAPPRLGLPFTTKLVIGGVLVAAICMSIALAAVALWVVSMVLPVIIIAGAVAWAAMRYRRWQLLRSQRDGLFHPLDPGPPQPRYPPQPGGFGQ